MNNATVPIICNEFVLLSNWMCNYVSCTALSQYGHGIHTIAGNHPENQPIINSLAAYKMKSEHWTSEECCMHSRFWIFVVVSAIFFCVHTHIHAHTWCLCIARVKDLFLYLSRFDWASVKSQNSIQLFIHWTSCFAVPRPRAKTKLLIKILCCKYIGAVNNSANNVNIVFEINSARNLSKFIHF